MLSWKEFIIQMLDKNPPWRLVVLICASLLIVFGFIAIILA